MVSFLFSNPVKSTLYKRIRKLKARNRWNCCTTYRKKHIKKAFVASVVLKNLNTQSDLCIKLNFIPYFSSTQCICYMTVIMLLRVCKLKVAESDKKHEEIDDMAFCSYNDLNFVSQLDSGTDLSLIPKWWPAPPLPQIPKMETGKQTKHPLVILVCWRAKRKMFLFHTSGKNVFIQSGLITQWLSVSQKKKRGNTEYVEKRTEICPYFHTFRRWPPKHICLWSTPSCLIPPAAAAPTQLNDCEEVHLIFF